jgi:TRAP-type C4-dicarboxylate transport system substrate-binding protein
MVPRYFPRRRFLAASAALPLLMACAPREPGVRVVTIGGTTAPRTPGAQTWLDFQAAVEARAQGAMRLRPLIYGQLGSEEQLLSGLRRGRIQFANLSAQVTSTVVPELALLYAPFLFADEGEADFIYDTYLTAAFRDLLRARGLHLLSWYEIGFNEIWGKRPILAPEDARGRRFRVSAGLNARLFAGALGADVIPLGFGDIVPSLQTGLIEAGENAVSLYSRTGIAGEAPHLTLTHHSFGVSVIVSPVAWWDALADDERAILAESFPSVVATRAIIRAQVRDDLAQAAELGIVVHEITPEQREQWRRATASVTPELLQAIGGRSAEIYRGIEAARAAYGRRLQLPGGNPSGASPPGGANGTSSPAGGSSGPSPPGGGSGTSSPAGGSAGPSPPGGGSGTSSPAGGGGG